MKRAVLLLSLVVLLALSAHRGAAQAPFEDAVVDVGDVGLTVTNAGFVGRSNVRNNPTGPPSFEYPLNSGVEHLFEAGLWVGARRPGTGDFQVRTGAITVSSGYQPGASGYELAPVSPILQRSSLPNSDFFNRSAVSHEDLIASFADTFAVLPGTNIPMPDPAGELGLGITMRSYAWNFPFTEDFVILHFEVVNTGPTPIDSVYVGLYHDLVVRNVNTTTDTGSDFFNKGGLGYIDSLQTSYAFNAGGAEETVNTYGAVSVLGARWPLPDAGGSRFFHPSVADEYRREGLTAPRVNPRWWLFSNAGQPQFSRPENDRQRYERMGTPYPNPSIYPGCDGVQDVDCTAPGYQDARESWYERLRTDGLTGNGNWIGLTPLGPFPTVAPGDTLQITFGMVAALKPDEFQGQAGKPIDTPESRRILRDNVQWARRTFSGEDANYNGELDPGEDINGNGRLDRYLIPEPPRSPELRTAFEQTDDESSQVALYWDRSAETSIDPVTGDEDFEGYRIYRSNPGAERSGNILDQATLVAQYDQQGNATGINNGFEEIRLTEERIPDSAVDSGRDEDGRVYVTFEEGPDATRYYYRYDAGNLLSGWQYLFSVTAFDTGNEEAGLASFESGRSANAVRVFPGTPASTDPGQVGVYPNPYRVRAAWDGETSRTRRLNFYNLPERCTIRIYTLAGEIIKEMRHDAATNTGDIRWYEDFSGENRQIAGGEHSWDILSENQLDIASGLYFFTVENADNGDIQRGKFVIIK